MDDGRYVGYTASGHLLSFGEGDGSALAGPFDPSSAHAPPMPVTRVLSDVRETWINRLAWMDVSSTGTLVYVPGNVTRRRLVWVDRSGRREALPQVPSGYEQISLSADGRRAAFVELEAVTVLDLDRGSRRSVAFSRRNRESSQQFAPGWMPDDRTLTLSSNHSGEWDLYLAPPDGEGEISRIELEGAQDRGASVTSQGAMAFISGARLEVMEPGESPRVFRDSILADGQPQFSPDGRALAYSTVTSGRQEA